MARQRPPRAGRTLLRGWSPACLRGGLVAPLVPFVHQQFPVNQTAGKGFDAPTNTGAAASTHGSGPAYGFLANLLWAAWGYHSNPVMTDLGALWPAGMLVASRCSVGAARRRRRRCSRSRGSRSPGCSSSEPQKQFLFDLRYFIGCVPMIVMVARRRPTTWPNAAGRGRGHLCGVLGLSLGLGLWDQQLNGDNPSRYDFQPSWQTIERPGVRGRGHPRP